MSRHGPLRIGIGGPVGSGKTTLIEMLCKAMRESYSVAVITNDIYTKEDALILNRVQALPEDRIMGVETGGCPHTAIREDASINLSAIAEMNARHKDLDIIFIESGGDNLAATFSPDLADITLYVISVCQGEKIPRKGGPAISRSDLLIINKMDLAPHVNARLDVMEDDTKKVRNGKPYVFTDTLRRKGLSEVISFIEAAGGLEKAGASEGERELVIQASGVAFTSTSLLDNFRLLLLPINDLETAVEMLDKGGAAFHPVAVVEIVDAVDHPVVRGMDMAADHALAAARMGLADHGFLKA